MLQLAKSRSHLLQSLSSQLSHRCFAGGTPKGKAKIKEGGPRKKSKITRKKPSQSSSERPISKAETEKQRLYDECLNAPTPVRFLKPKERAREAEREKLGLESKERKREKEILKKGGKESMGITNTPFLMGPPGLDFITLGLVDADKIPKYELTAEDGKRLAKEYSRFLMRKHRARQAALSNLLRCKKEAIEALPEHLKVEALVPDYTPFPKNRIMAALTPPIEGYMEKMNEASKRSSGSEKIR